MPILPLFLKNIKEFKIDAIVAIGGDDTLGVAAKLHKLHIPIVGVPKTIDNDLSGTDYTFGFDNLIVDMRSIPIIQEETNYPVIFDGTHSAQIPGNSAGTTGGLRKYIPTTVKAAIAAGCDGLFLEVHDDVDNAKSDAATQYPLEQLESLLVDVKRLREVIVNG